METGDRWQKPVAEFLKPLRPELIVETGIESGLSTGIFLQMLDENGSGILCSCDPDPEKCSIKEHPRWHLFPKKSITAIPEMYQTYGPFDVFIHDSDHYVECQTLEYFLAWHLVKPGGWIISDDIQWDTPPHLAWDNFLRRHNLRMEKIGHAGVTQKPDGGPGPPRNAASLAVVVKSAMEFAHSEAVRYDAIKKANSL